MIQGGQFAIMREPIVRSKYVNERLRDGWFLSYYEKLPVYKNEDKDVILIGEAWQTVAGQKSPREAIDASEKPQDVFEAEANWAGRYVLVLDGKVMTDATASMQVFRSHAGVSSDISFLAEATHSFRMEWEPDDLLPWYPGPETPYSEIRRLLPSQAYDYRDQKLHFRRLFGSSAKQYQNIDELAEATYQMALTSFVNMRTIHPNSKYYVEMSKDEGSGALLALAKKAGIPADAVVLERAEMCGSDTSSPLKMCEITESDLKYQEKDPARKSMKRSREFLRHLSHMAKGAVAEAYEYQQYKELATEDMDAIIVRNSICEAFASVRKQFGDWAYLSSGVLMDTYELKDATPESESLKECLHWFEDWEAKRVGGIDRYAWEQVLGCKYAEEEHGFDIFDDIKALQPLNCRNIIAMLLQFPEDEAENSAYMKRIAVLAFPEVSEVAVPKDKVSVSKHLKNAGGSIGRLARRIKRTGIGRTFKYYGAGVGDAFRDIADEVKEKLKNRHKEEEEMPEEIEDTAPVQEEVPAEPETETNEQGVPADENESAKEPEEPMGE